MSRILIASRAFDEHAIVVQLALQKMGHEVARWIGADFPSQQQVSIHFHPDRAVKTHLQGSELPAMELDADCFWYRRPSSAVLPTAWLNPADIPAAQHEMDWLSTALKFMLPERTAWVNPWSARDRACHKSVQLEAARKVGFKTLPTLISNNPDDIKNFISEAKQSVVYKTFYPMRWNHENSVKKATTNPVTLADLPSDKILISVPGIYQYRVEKSFELRICCMGRTCFAMRIDSQKVTQATEDFRRVPIAQLPSSPFELPEDLERLCLALMASLGLVFGSIDLLVTKDQEIIFLEVNEQGQFLWMEQLCPSLPLLDAMCAFLVNPVATFRYEPLPGRIPLMRFLDSDELKQQMLRDRSQHVFKPNLALGERPVEEGPPILRTAMGGA